MTSRAYIVMEIGLSDHDAKIFDAYTKAVSYSMNPKKSEIIESITSVTFAELNRDEDDLYLELDGNVLNGRFAYGLSFETLQKKLNNAIAALKEKGFNVRFYGKKLLNASRYLSFDTENGKIVSQAIDISEN